MESARTVRTWRRRAADLRDSVNFRLRPPDWSEEVTRDLPFGEAAVERYIDDLASCRTYLEYGSGSSTLWAVEAGCQVVTVESDASFLASLEGRCRKVARPADAGSMSFIHADIGRTGPWGVPSTRLSASHQRARWAAYPMAPWVTLGRDFRADLILVDGRFRVACALAVVLMQGDSEWRLLFDDYADRQEYWPIERFADLVELRGRMAVFQPKSGVDLVEAGAAYDAFGADWR